LTFIPLARNLSIQPVPITPVPMTAIFFKLKMFF